MKNNTYQNAVDHLEFSDELYERVAQNAQTCPRPVRLLRAVAIAAVITAILATTATGVSSVLKDILDKKETEVPVQTLGTQEDTFEDAKVMEFTLSNELQGVKVHYMELELGESVQQYQFLRGLLYNWAGTYYRITEDYQLENVVFQNAVGCVNKGDTQYKVYPDYQYLDTPDGVISVYHNALPKNVVGEILINVYAQGTKKPANIGDPAWPAYLDVKTGQIRDALPQRSPDDFEGRICYTRRFKNGILISTLVNEGTKHVTGRRYWVEETTQKTVQITIPDNGIDFCYRDTLYYQDAKGKLYRMDDSFRFHLVSDYETPALFGGGLLEVITDDGKLGIFDVDTGMTYVFAEIPVTENDILSYNSLRRGNRILLVKTENNWELMGKQVTQVGLMDMENRQLVLLEFDNDMVCLHCHWLDDDRIAMIYQRDQQQYLGIYEFE